MSELIRSWLNDEVQLSRPVVDFERDFSNGYLIGELLTKFNQQMDFNFFIDSEQRNHKINNFKLLEPTFKSLSIKFSAQIADGILKEKPGEALKLLYQLKMALERVNNPADINVFNDTGKLNTISPIRQFKPRKEKFDTMESHLFSKRLNNLNASQKSLNLEKHLSKYREVMYKSLDKAEFMRKQEEAAERLREETTQKFRTEQLLKFHRNKNFMDEWTTKGLESWQKNMDVKKEREQKDREFALLLATRSKSQLLKRQKQENSDVIEGIADFEKKFSKLETDEFGETVARVSKQLEKSTFFSTTESRPNHREKMLLSEEERKEREKRRRKMVVDQSHQQTRVEVARKEEILLEKISQQSQQEKQIDYEVWRNEQYKNIIIEDRNLREEKYNSKREDIIYHAQLQEEQLFNFMTEERDREVEQREALQKELEIEFKTEKRMDHYHSCQNLTDMIFEIAELCFMHLQDRDTEAIDSRFLKEYSNLFIEGAPLIPRKTIRHSNGVKVLSTPDNQIVQESAEQLAEMELQDYINGLGQWKPTHNFAEPENEDDNKYIPNKPVNNFLLGGVVETIIDANFPEKRPPASSDMPNYMPLKLMMMGYAFSGKRSLCKVLKEKYGLKVLQLDEIIKEAIEMSSIEEVEATKPWSGSSSPKKTAKDHVDEGTNENPFQQSGQVALRQNSKGDNADEIQQEPPRLEAEENQQNEGVQVYQIEEVQVQNLKSEELPLAPVVERNYTNEMKALGSVIKSLLIAGKPIPDDIYLQAILLKIQMLFPKKTDQELVQDLEEAKAQFGNHSPPTFEIFSNKIHKKDAALSSKLTTLKQIPYYYTKGWILLGFPNNYRQAKALETALSGYIVSDELAPTKAEINKEKASKIVKAIPNKSVPRKLIKGGIDAAISLQIPKSECLRRALGRRIDPETNEIYHLDDNPPPFDRSPFVEYLTTVNDPLNSEFAITEKNIYYDTHKDDLEHWLANFGLETANINCLQKINANSSLIDLCLSVDERLTKVLEVKHQEYENFLEEYKTRGERELQAEEEKRKQQEEEAQMVLIEREKLQELLAQVQKDAQLANLTPDIVKILNEAWEASLNQYVTQSKQVFQSLREQRNTDAMRIAEIQKRFLDLITARDDRMLHVLKYQKDYNQFVDENPDMCEEDDTKEELHQRVEDLHQFLWEQIENKKELLLAEHAAVVKSGYVEDQMEYFMNNIHKLFQTELDRYSATVQLLNDYYNIVGNKDLADVPENPFPEFNGQVIASTPLEDAANPNVFPRIEKIYNDAIKILNAEQIDQPNPTDKKGGKVPPPKKEDPKKAVKKGAQPEEEEPKEMTPLEKEHKQAISMEKAVMRYRFYMIKCIAENKMKEIRQSAQTTYNKLEDWIHYSIKAENEALKKIMFLFREAIENQTKIQKELQLNYVDAVQSSKYLNYKDPEPTLLPAKETNHGNRFTVSQLYTLVQELSYLTNASFMLNSRELVEFFSRKVSSGLDSGYPKEWQGFEPIDFKRFVNNLDPNASGMISYKVLITYCALYDVPLPDELTLEAMKEAYNAVAVNGCVKKSDFLEMACWFDEYIAAEPMKDYCVFFDRVKLIKELLYKTNKERRDESVNIEFYLRTLKGQDYLNTEGEECSKESKTYRYLLFNR